MIVQESDPLLQALDQRLQVDRVLALDPLEPVAGAGGDRGPTLAQTGGSNGSTAASASAAGEAALVARLPLGRIVPATVVEFAGVDHVVAEVEQWRVALAWPSGAAPALRIGQQIALRVLAHQPMLLFQSVDESGEAIESSGRNADTPARWSQNAIELSRQSVAADTRGVSEVTRFTEPIVQIRILSSAKAPVTDRIALDDVIVGHADPGSEPSVSAPARPVADAPGMPQTVLPAILQGPAWPGQPMELIVRREQADEALDNPVLDAWCGDLTIDLPTLGRVSGRLAFSMQGLRIRLEGDDTTTVSAMHEASATLAAALADVALRVQSLSIGNSRCGDAALADGDSAAMFRDHG